MMIAQTKAFLPWRCALAGLVVLAGCALQPEFQLAAVESRIVTVNQWGGTPADESRMRKHAVTRITLQHQGAVFTRDNDPVQYLRNLQTWSREARKWPDILYHYIINLVGNIYAGRDIRFAGDTNTEYDPAGHALIEVVVSREIAWSIAVPAGPGLVGKKKGTMWCPC